MTVWIVILEDRHDDVQVEAFITPNAAIDRAQAIVTQYGYTDPDQPPLGDWLFSAVISREGDAVSVRRVEVKE